MRSVLSIDHDRLVDLLGFEGQLLTAATLDPHPATPVAGASGGTVGETVRRIGDACEDALSWLGFSEAAARNWVLPEQPSLRELTGRFSARMADLLAEFGTRPPEDTCPTWWPEDHSVGFWLRRMVHATTVHRVDVQTAAGVEMTPIEPDIAADGVDEILRMWFGYRLCALGIGSLRPFSIGVRTAGRHWRVVAAPEHVEVDEAGPEAEAGVDALLLGDPVSVYLWLWGRLPDRAVETGGDQDAIAQLWGLLRLATR